MAQRQHNSGTHERKKRRSKYDVAKIYEGASTKPYFMIQPGDSNFYQHKERSLNTNDPSLNLRPQKDRTIFSFEQMLILERAFQMDKHPSNEIRKSVACLSELSLERVRIWYQNRRAKEKRDEEDRLAMLAEKLNKDQSSAYNTEQFPCRSTINQKLIQLDRLFGEKRPSQQTLRSIKPRIQHNKRYHPYDTSSRRDNHEKYRSNVADETNEFECVKNLLHSPSDNLRAEKHKRYEGNISQNDNDQRILPGIKVFSEQLDKRYDTRAPTATWYSSSNRHHEHDSSKQSKHITDEELFIEDFMKREFSSDNNVEGNSTEEFDSLPTTEQQNDQSLSTQFDTMMQNAYQMQISTAVQQSLTQDQLNVIQLLNQKNLLEQLQHLLCTNIQTGQECGNTQISGNLTRDASSQKHHTNFPTVYDTHTTVRTNKNLQFLHQ